MKSLSEMNLNEICVVDKVLTVGSIKRRFTDIGLIEGTRVKCVGISPAGDPKAFLIRGAVIAIRISDGSQVIVR